MFWRKSLKQLFWSMEYTFWRLETANLSLSRGEMWHLCSEQRNHILTTVRTKLTSCLGKVQRKQSTRKFSYINYSLIDSFQISVEINFLFINRITTFVQISKWGFLFNKVKLWENVHGHQLLNQLLGCIGNFNLVDLGLFPFFHCYAVPTHVCIVL